MASRLSLHEKLLALFPANKQYVYFQPPESVKMKYPCIVYERTSADIKYADNLAYNYTKAYQVTIIDLDPDSEYVDKLFTAFPMTRFVRHFVSDNLNHDVFIIYY